MKIARGVERIKLRTVTVVCLPPFVPRTVVVDLELHLLGDLVALFAQRGLLAMMGQNRCFHCEAGSATLVNGAQSP